LDSGPPPVVIGFGSMTGRGSEEWLRISLDAIRICGRRGIILTGTAPLEETPRGKDVFLTDFVPHAWLYARAAAADPAPQPHCPKTSFRNRPRADRRRNPAAGGRPGKSHPRRGWRGGGGESDWNTQALIGFHYFRKQSGGFAIRYSFVTFSLISLSASLISLSIVAIGMRRTVNPLEVRIVSRIRSVSTCDSCTLPSISTTSLAS
jgi:hypothetical protein